MRNLRPFLIFQNNKFLFILHAYSAKQANALLPARLTDLTNILITAPRKNSPLYRDIYR
jgi:hypothetical protein